MNNNLEIYVQGVRLDLFKDESININTSTKNFKNIEKVFTSFSRKMTIPASKVNNKIFKHYSNTDISSGGFDARAQVSAELKLNGNTLEKGKVVLESVKERNGVTDSYSIRFYGAMTEFTKRLGSDFIHNVDTSADDIDSPDYQNIMQSALFGEQAVTFPLSSNKNRFIYHSTDPDYAATSELQNTKNIAWSTNTLNDQYGVTSDELTGAYRVGHLLSHIADHYNLNLTGAINAGYIRNYRILLNAAGRKDEGSELKEYTPSQYPLTEGSIETLSPFWSDFSGDPTTTLREMAIVDHSEYGQTILRLTSNFRRIYSTNIGLIRDIPTGSGGYEEDMGGIDYRPKLKVRVQTSLSNFEVIVKKDGEEIGTITESTTTDSFSYSAILDNGGGAFGTEGAVSSQGDISFLLRAEGNGSVDIDYRIATSASGFSGSNQYRENLGTYYSSYETLTIATSSTGESGYIVSSLLPKMKVTDLFATLIKQFNLVPEVTINDNGTHEVNFKHYDYYINQGTERDITKYVDNSTRTVSPLSAYSGLNFEHKDPQSAMEEAYFQVNRRKYGGLSYEYESDESKINGELYDVKIDTHRVPLERLTDLSTNNETETVWLQLTDINSNRASMGATFLYCAKNYIQSVAFNTGTTVNKMTGIIYPTNVYYSTQTISPLYGMTGNYWGSETDEHTGNSLFSGLGNFNLFWYNYIRIMFSSRTRKVNLKAFFTEGVLIDLKPSDILKIGDKKYLIESYNTNYNTMQTDLSLIQVPNDLLVAFQSNNIDTDNTGYTNNNFAQIYMSSATGYISISPFTNVFTVGEIKHMNLID